MTGHMWPVVACTGHRTLPNHRWRWVRWQLNDTATRLRDHHGTREALTGLALNTDTLWAWAAHTRSIRFAAYIPFPQQPAGWNQRNQHEWRELRRLAHREVIAGDLDGLPDEQRRSTAVQLLHARNDAMLRDCNAVVAVWDGREQGGTYSAVRKAQRLNLPIIHINPANQTVTWPTRVEATLW